MLSKAWFVGECCISCLRYFLNNQWYFLFFEIDLVPGFFISLFKYIYIIITHCHRVCEIQVICTLGSVVFVSILLIRGIWTGITYVQEGRPQKVNAFDDDHRAWTGTQPSTWFVLARIRKCSKMSHHTTIKTALIRGAVKIKDVEMASECFCLWKSPLCFWWYNDGIVHEGPEEFILMILYDIDGGDE